jgi:hypothetical protein
MLKTAAGPDGNFTVGDYAPPDRAKDFVAAGIAEWVDDADASPDYESNSFGGQSVTAFAEILDLLGLDFSREIVPRDVAAAVRGEIEDLRSQVADLEAVKKAAGAEVDDLKAQLAELDSALSSADPPTLESPPAAEKAKAQPAKTKEAPAAKTKRGGKKAGGK